MLIDSTTYGTALAGIGRRYAEYRLSGKCRLVSELRAEVVVGPADADIPILDADALRLRPDTSKVFEHEQSPYRIRVHECLGDAVVHIAHPAVLSRANLPEPAPCGRSAALLELLPDLGEFCVLGFDCGAGDERAALSVIRCNDLPEPPVYPDNMRDVPAVRRFVMHGDGDMQEDTATYVNDELCRSILPCMRSERAGACAKPDASVKRIDGKDVSDNGPVPVVDQVILRDTETYPDALMPVGSDRTVLRDDRLQDGLGHLGLEPVISAEYAIEFSMERDDILVPGVEDNPGNEVACGTVRLRRPEKSRDVFGTRIESHFFRYGCLDNHTTNIQKLLIINKLKRNRLFPPMIEVTGFYRRNL